MFETKDLQSPFGSKAPDLRFLMLLRGILPEAFSYSMALSLVYQYC
jgi:hypothetical protein